MNYPAAISGPAGQVGVDQGGNVGFPGRRGAGATVLAFIFLWLVAALLASAIVVI